MKFENWRKSFLIVILSLGSLVLSVFGAIYYKQGNFSVAIIESIGALLMFGSLVAVLAGINLILPSVVAWMGLLSVLVMLLVTGGIGGTGLIWWGLLPTVSYVMFGSSGGAVSFLIGLFVLIGGWVVRFFEPGSMDIYFDPLQIRQGIVFYIVVGIIVHFYEQMAGNARDSAMSRKEELEREISERKKTEIELNNSLKKIQEEQLKQADSRVAMLNLLDDAKELENQLKVEKAGVEKKVEERTYDLSVEKNRLRAVLDNLVRGIMVVDKNKNVILWNKKLSFNIGSSEAVNFDFLDKFLVGFDLSKKVEEAFVKKEIVSAEKFLIGTLYFDLFVVPILNDGTVENIAIFVDDVTERVAIERSKDEFFSIASHELRTPLTAIRGNAEMILDNYKDKIKDKNVTEMLDDIHEGSVRLIEIVNDFLNVSRLEMGKLDFKMEPVDLVDLGAKVIKEFQVTGSRQKVAIDLVLPDKELPKAMVDADRLKQVIINLLGNALKFTRDGHIKVKLVDDVDMVKLSVIDTGDGIAKEQQGLLFHKFQQAGSSLYTRDTSKGTGLGLYISKMMIDGMGGKIWLEKSEIGKGSTFSISLKKVVES